MTANKINIQTMIGRTIGKNTRNQLIVIAPVNLRNIKITVNRTNISPLTTNVLGVLSFRGILSLR